MEKGSSINEVWTVHSQRTATGTVSMVTYNKLSEKELKELKLRPEAIRRTHM